jgi:hypothetical protein
MSKKHSLYRNLLCSILLALSIPTYCHSQNDSINKNSATYKIKVQLIDKSTKQPLPFANVVVQKNGVDIVGGVTDINGTTSIELSGPWNYVIKAVYEGYKDTAVEVKPNETKIQIALESVKILPRTVIVHFEPIHIGSQNIHQSIYMTSIVPNIMLMPKEHPILLDFCGDTTYLESFWDTPFGSDVIATHTPIITQKEENVTSGTIKVRLFDSTTKQPLPFANVVIQQKGVQVNGGVTNIDGCVVIPCILPGDYDITAAYEGYEAPKKIRIHISELNVTYLKIEMKPNFKGMIVDYFFSCWRPFNTTYQATYDRDDINHSAVK